MMVPEWCLIRYRVQTQVGKPDRVAGMRVECGGSCDDGTVALRFSRDDNVIEIRVQSSKDVVVEQCRVGFMRTFVEGDRILLNGYQSWTDTEELGPDATMQGLRRAPKGVVRAWRLDAGGDYEFAPYSGNPGKLHGFTYATVRQGQDYELLGSLSEDDGFTLIVVDVSMDSVVVDKECPLEAIPAGELRAICRLALVSGTCDQVYDTWFKLADTQALPAPPLVGYTSWYRHYGKIDARKLESDLKGVCRVLDGQDCSGMRKVFQIDDGYCPVGDWMWPHCDRFPRGMAPLAKRIRDAGLLPGIWVAPFVCERHSRVFREHHDWILRKPKGALVHAGSQWSGAYALDTLNPAVRAYVTTALRTLVEGWGFGLVKTDFLYAACMVPHGGMNRGQLMADALGLLRQAVGPDVAILGCGVPLGSAFGKVEYCRVGCDVGFDWDGKPYMRALNRERVSTRNSLTNTVFRAPLDGRAFACDPDVFFLRDDVQLTSDQKGQLLAVDSVYGGMLLTSDDMGQWNDSQLAWFRAAADVLRQRKMG
jgi:alpha-galactosidase